MYVENNVHVWLALGVSGSRGVCETVGIGIRKLQHVALMQDGGGRARGSGRRGGRGGRSRGCALGRSPQLTQQTLRGSRKWAAGGAGVAADEANADVAPSGGTGRGRDLVRVVTLNDDADRSEIAEDVRKISSAVRQTAVATPSTCADVELDVGDAPPDGGWRAPCGASALWLHGYSRDATFKNGAWQARAVKKMCVRGQDTA